MGPQHPFFSEPDRAGRQSLPPSFPQPQPRYDPISPFDLQGSKRKGKEGKKKKRVAGEFVFLVFFLSFFLLFADGSFA